MNDLELNLKKQSESISTKRVNDVFKLYYETRDLKVREQLIYRYMLVVKRTLLRFKIAYMDEEDFGQAAYEILIRSIDEFNPFESVSFSRYLNRKLKSIYKEYLIGKEQDSISLSDVEIYSNDNLEDATIYKMTKAELVDKLEELLKNYPFEKTKEHFKQIYGIYCEAIKTKDIARKERISLERLRQQKFGILFYLFFNLPKEHQYYPSRLIEEILKRPSYGSDCMFLLSKELKNKIYNFDLDEVNYLMYYDSCNNLDDSHKYFKIKK